MMLRIYTSTSVKEAEHYYIKSASKEAYYSEGQEFTGYWGGKAAPMLGLSGRVGEAEFMRLCNNLHPLTGDQLTPRMKSDRRPGFDFNFNCPKSVSLAYAYTHDKRIVQALRQAVQDMMEEMEQLVETRVRTFGRDENRVTGKWVYGEFIHLTARPENGIPDPHLHVHCYVFNTTYDDAEQRWKAIELGDVFDHANDFDRIVLRKLSENLHALGLSIVANEKSFEIEGIERGLIEQFSQRTHRIHEEAAKRGITDPKEVARLAALTRENKSKTLRIPELEKIWWAGLSPEHRQQLENVKAVLGQSHAVDIEQKVSLNRATAPVKAAPKVVVPTEFDRRAVALAVEHIFERNSTATTTHLVSEACKNWCVGKTTVDGIRQAIAETPLIWCQRNGKAYATTNEVIAEEDRLKHFCLMGQFRCKALNLDWKIQDERLNIQQRAAVQHVLKSEHRVVGITGKAGAGKTTLLHEAKRGIEAAGKRLLVLAPTSEAARDVLRKEGFENAETVAQLLVNESLQREARGAVWWVDEAGLLSTRTADKLFALAEKLEARLVLVGDTGQHHAVERGQAFDLLERYAHMPVARVDKILRQHGSYRAFVEHVAEGRMDEAFDLLVQSKWVFEMPLAERKVALAKDYVEAMEHHKTALVVAPTHAECLEITDGIRHALKEKKLLDSPTQCVVLQNLSWTDAQKRDSEHYKPGLIVQINRHVKGFSLGEQLTVTQVGKNYVLGLDSSGYPKKIPLASPEAFEVYERNAIEICRGERIRITSNGRSAEGHRLNNGNLHTVDYIALDGKLVLENGWRLRADFLHFDYGYTMTSHAAQGKTVDYVFIAQSAQLSLGATDAKQFYVSVSRGREGMKLYTDSIDILRENVSRRRERLMAIDLVEKGEPIPEVHHQTARFLGTQEFKEQPRESKQEMQVNQEPRIPSKSKEFLGQKILTRKHPIVKAPQKELEMEM